MAGDHDKADAELRARRAVKMKRMSMCFEVASGEADAELRGCGQSRTADAVRPRAKRCEDAGGKSGLNGEAEWWRMGGVR